MELLDILDQDDNGSAIADFTEIIELNPSNAKAYNNRGIAYREKGENTRAIADFNKAIELDPNNAEVYFNRGVAYYIEDDGLDHAIADFTKAIELDPYDRMHYYLRGFCYDFQGDNARAIADYSAVMELTPDDPDAYFFRGKIYRDTGTYECAIEDFNKAIELYPDYTVAYYYRGETWLRLSKWNNARADLVDAKSKGLDIIRGFCEDYKNIEGFEKKYNVTFPEDITAMLTPEHARASRIRDENNKERTVSWIF